ncbi:MAG: hypothetical protein ACYCQM_08535 [Acidithiobacillus sp.]
MVLISVKANILFLEAADDRASPVDFSDPTVLFRRVNNGIVYCGNGVHIPGLSQ